MSSGCKKNSFWCVVVVVSAPLSQSKNGSMTWSWYPTDKSMHFNLGWMLQFVKNIIMGSAIHWKFGFNQYIELINGQFILSQIDWMSFALDPAFAQCYIVDTSTDEVVDAFSDFIVGVIEPYRENYTHSVSIWCSDAYSAPLPSPDALVVSKQKFEVWVCYRTRVLHKSYRSTESPSTKMPPCWRIHSNESQIN